MATITPRKRQKGITYRAEVRVAGHSPLSRTFDKLSEAHTWAEETEAVLRAGGYIGEAPLGDMDFETAINKYTDEVSINKAINTSQREATAAVHLKKFFEKNTLRGITPGQVAAYRDKRLKLIKPSTLQKELALLSHLYTVADSDWSLEINNPVARIRKPKIGPGRVRFLTKKEAARLLPACKKNSNKKLYYFVLLMLHSAMRPSEAAGLKWSQVFLDDRVIDLTVTKTDPRRVPITETAVAALEELQKTATGDTVFLPEKVSVNIQRRPNLYFRRSYTAALAAADIKDFTMHDLRHTAASYLLMAGADLRTLAEILGHKGLSTVQRYTHLLDEHKIKTIDKINDLGI